MEEEQTRMWTYHVSYAFRFREGVTISSTVLRLDFSIRTTSDYARLLARLERTTGNRDINIINWMPLMDDYSQPLSTVRQSNYEVEIERINRQG